MQKSCSAQRSKSQITIYFDNSATSVRSEEFVSSYLEEFNKSRTYKEELVLLQDLASKLSSLFKTSPNHFSFVPNSTYGLNEIACFLSSRYSDIPVYLSNLEHAANHAPWFKFFKQKPIFFDPNTLDFQLPLGEGIVSFSPLTNLEGVELDLNLVLKKNNFDSKILVLDATQYVAYRELDLSDTPFDYVVFSAHKIGGPNGLGVIYSKSGYGLGINAQNYILKHKSYTLDYAGIFAWLKVLNKTCEFSNQKIISELNCYFLDNFPENEHVRILNRQTKTCIFLLEVISKDISAHDFAFYLSQNGVIVRTGLSCSLLSAERLDPSKLIRVSLSPLNSKEEIDFLFNLLKKFEIYDCF